MLTGRPSSGTSNRSAYLLATTVDGPVGGEGNSFSSFRNPAKEERRRGISVSREPELLVVDDGRRSQAGAGGKTSLITMLCFSFVIPNRSSGTKIRLFNARGVEESLIGAPSPTEKREGP